MQSLSNYVREGVERTLHRKRVLLLDMQRVSRAHASKALQDTKWK